MDQLPRLTRNEALVLDLLYARPEAYGLELVEESGGALKRGSVYVTLNRVEEAGLVKSWKEEAPKGQQGPPRRKYRLTGHGQRVVEAYRQASAAANMAWGRLAW